MSVLMKLAKKNQALGFIVFCSHLLGRVLSADPQPASPSPPTPAPSTTDSTIPEIVVTGSTDAFPAAIEPSLGVRTYTLDQTKIESLPQGADTPFDQVVERTPGVTPDAFGQYHIRGEDYNQAFELNGIRIPQGIVNSTFGEQFDTRFISNLTLIDGAVPAQYGLNTAGIFDIQSKEGADLEGGEVSLYGGSYNTIHPSFSYGGVSGNTDYFVQGSINRNDNGVSSPTGTASTIHDQTTQYKGFAYLSEKLDDTSQLMFILSGSDSDFQIPNTPGLPVAFLPASTSYFDSAQLNQNQNDNLIMALSPTKRKSMISNSKAQS
jgi:outer membrane cobalamin receptor